MKREGIIVRNTSETRIRCRFRVDGRGQYQIAFPGGQGDYIMGFALVGYNFRQFEIKRTADQDVLVADARLSVVQLDTVTVQESVQQRVSRNSRTPDVSGTERAVSPADSPVEAQRDLAVARLRQAH